MLDRIAYLSSRWSWRPWTGRGSRGGGRSAGRGGRWWQRGPGWCCWRCPRGESGGLRLRTGRGRGTDAARLAGPGRPERRGRLRQVLRRGAGRLSGGVRRLPGPRGEARRFARREAGAEAARRVLRGGLGAVSAQGALRGHRAADPSADRTPVDRPEAAGRSGRLSRRAARRLAVRVRGVKSWVPCRRTAGTATNWASCYVRSRARRRPGRWGRGLPEDLGAEPSRARRRPLRRQGRAAAAAHGRPPAVPAEPG